MRSVLAIFLLVVLVPAFFIVFLVTSVRVNLLQATFLKTTLAKERVYTLVLQAAQDKLGEFRLEENPFLKPEDLRTILARVITEGWLQVTVEQTLDRAFAWFNDPSPAPLTLPIDLRDPKQRLTAELSQLLDQQLATFPTCPPNSKEGELCRPANISDEQIREMIKQSGFEPAELLKQLPDTLDLTKPHETQFSLNDETNKPDKQPEKQKDPDEDLLPKLQRLKGIYHQGLSILRFSYFVLGALIAGYIALVIRGIRRTVRWLGALLVTLGVAPLAAALASQPLLRQYLIPQLRFPDELATFAPAVFGAIFDVQRAIFQPLLMWGMILVSIGAAGIVASFFLPKRQPKPKRA